MVLHILRSYAIDSCAPFLQNRQQKHKKTWTAVLPSVKNPRTGFYSGIQIAIAVAVAATPPARR